MAVRDLTPWFRRQSAPITIGILASMIISATIWLVMAGQGVEQVALLSDWSARPWTLITYPWGEHTFASTYRILGLVFLAMWLYFAGSAVERDIGAGKYIALWLAMILLPAVSIIVFAPVTGVLAAVGMWLPAAGITLVWCMRNPHAQVMLYGVLPLNGRVLAWITVAATLVLTGLKNPMLGVASSLHLAIAWAFATDRIPFWRYSGTGAHRAQDSRVLKKTERLGERYYDDVKRREKERDERERLRRMFESSIQDDPDQKGD